MENQLHKGKEEGRMECRREGLPSKCSEPPLKIIPQPLRHSPGRAIHCLPPRGVRTTQSLPSLLMSGSSCPHQSFPGGHRVLFFLETDTLSSSPLLTIQILEWALVRFFFPFSLSETWKWSRSTCNSILRKSYKCTGKQDKLCLGASRGVEDA